MKSLCFADFLLYHFKLLIGMTTRPDDLEAINKTGGEEIDDDLNPKCNVFGTNVLQGAAHRTKVKESANTEGTREEPGDALPETGMLL